MKRNSKPEPALAADEIRVVVYSRDEQLSQTASLNGKAVGSRELRAAIEAAVMGIGFRAAERDRPATPLSVHEQEVLGRLGYEPREPTGLSGSESAAIAYASLVENSLDVGAAARLLRVNTSRIRQRLLARELYGIKDGKRWLLPRFQFLRGRLVPGIERVIPQIPEGMPPLAAIRWFFIPHPDLVHGDDETPTTPMEWLAGGRDPERVAELAGEVGLV